MSPGTCKLCGGETGLSTIESVAGESHDLTITLRNFPVLSCEQSHYRFIRPEFPAQLLHHLTNREEPELPTGEEKGLIMKRYLCESCGSELDAAPDHRHTFSIDVELEQLEPFHVELTMPVFRCRKCEREQLQSLKEIRKLTPDALTNAFKAADIPPG
jgi:hypothetical protein